MAKLLLGAAARCPPAQAAWGRCLGVQRRGDALLLCLAAPPRLAGWVTERPCELSSAAPLGKPSSLETGGAKRQLHVSASFPSFIWQTVPGLRVLWGCGQGSGNAAKDEGKHQRDEKGALQRQLLLRASVLLQMAGRALNCSSSVLEGSRDTSNVPELALPRRCPGCGFFYVSGLGWCWFCAAGCPSAVFGGVPADSSARPSGTKGSCHCPGDSRGCRGERVPTSQPPPVCWCWDQRLVSRDSSFSFAAHPACVVPCSGAEELRCSRPCTLLLGCTAIAASGRAQTPFAAAAELKVALGHALRWRRGCKTLQLRSCSDAGHSVGA